MFVAAAAAVAVEVAVLGRVHRPFFGFPSLLLFPWCVRLLLLVCHARCLL